MRLAVNTVVVIVLGMVMVGVGISFLQTIIGVEDDVQEIGEDREQEILNNRPRGEEVYIHTSTVDIEDNNAIIPVAISNRFKNDLSPIFEARCVSCGGTTMTFTETSQNVSPGETTVIQGILSNTTWGVGQHTIVLNVTNSSGGVVGSETVIVQK